MERFWGSRLYTWAATSWAFGDLSPFFYKRSRLWFAAASHPGGAACALGISLGRPAHPQASRRARPCTWSRYHAHQEGLPALVLLPCTQWRSHEKDVVRGCGFTPSLGILRIPNLPLSPHVADEELPKKMHNMRVLS